MGHTLQGLALRPGGAAPDGFMSLRLIDVTPVDREDDWGCLATEGQLRLAKANEGKLLANPCLSPHSEPAIRGLRSVTRAQTRTGLYAERHSGVLAKSEPAAR